MFNRSGSNNLNLINAYRRTKNMVGALPPLRSRRRLYYFFAAIKIASIIVILSFLSLLIFLVLNFFNLKVIYQSALTGKDNLEYAADLIKDKDYQSAADFAETAEQNFQYSLERINVYYGNFIISRIPIISAQVNDFVYLLSTAEILSRAVKQGAQFGAGFDNIMNNRGATFGELTQTEKRQILKRIYESAPELAGIKANVELALLNLDNVSVSGLLWPFKNRITDLNARLLEMKYIFDKAIPVSQVLPAILGYPEQSSFLAILQNRDELRPTGGFIGTYGILEMKNSEIVRADTHDIYHMDMPVKDKIDIKPPAPLEKYLGVPKWYMRDANWSPDWPTAAAKIEWFYRMEDKLLPKKDRINNFDGEFDGLIGLNIQPIIDLLEMTGPVVLEGTEYSHKNFDKILEYRVEKGYEQLGIPSWQRKEVIGKITSVLQKRITEMPLNDFVRVAKIIDRNLQQKNIVVYLKEPALQEIIREQNWAGEIKNEKDDFFMIVDANMASFKTDAVVSRQIDYRLRQEINGIFADLTINYAHKGSIDWRTTRYRTYTRFYVPLGAKLVSAEGFKEEPVKIANELGKTVFSGFTVIEPGKIGSLHIYYQLPTELEQKVKNGQYRLYAQKQPGANIESLRIDLEFLNNIQSYEPTGFYINRINNRLNWETDLNTDRQLKLEL